MVRTRYPSTCLGSKSWDREKASPDPKFPGQESSQMDREFNTITLSVMHNKGAMDMKENSHAMLNLR